MHRTAERTNPQDRGHCMRANENVRGGAGRFISIVGMLGLIVGGLSWREARAEIQNEAIGFSPNHVLEATDQGENIDVMSGNLNLSIPLGPRHQLNEQFDYGLTLYYNSKIWEYDCPNGVDFDNPCFGELPPNRGVGLGWSL